MILKYTGELRDPNYSYGVPIKKITQYYEYADIIATQEVFCGDLLEVKKYQNEIKKQKKEFQNLQSLIGSEDEYKEVKYDIDVCKHKIEKAEKDIKNAIEMYFYVAFNELNNSLHSITPELNFMERSLENLGHLTGVLLKQLNSNQCRIIIFDHYGREVKMFTDNMKLIKTIVE
jgi:hypothetical protein